MQYILPYKWEFLFVKYEINSLTKEECIYVNGKLKNKRAIHGGFLGYFQSDLFHSFVTNCGLDGWELQSDWGDSSSRNLTFKRIIIEQNLTEHDSYVTEALFVITEKLKAIESNLKKPEQQLVSTFVITEKLKAIESNLKKPEQQLVSSIGIDYTRLYNLLVLGNWREADLETFKVLLKASEREEEGWLSLKAINKLSKEDLIIINQLWMKNSNGHFGYSIQKQVFEDLHSKSEEEDEKIMEKFGQLVGWRVNDKWLKYEQLKFQLNAPKGHLPTVNISWHTEGDWQRYVKFILRRVF